MVEISLFTVFVAALISALMTGLGAAPFAFVKSISKKWLCISSAIAGGFMLAASHSLITEGAVYSSHKTLLGTVIGLVAIMLSRWFLDTRTDVKFGDLDHADATKVLLILGIMTAHSFAEGISIGVSFGGGDALGLFITTAISLHNIPEGLAISLIMIPRGTSVLRAAGWSIFSSLPQPLMAVPAYLFVTTFEPFLPIGFGIAAGAMYWVVFAELVPEALGKKSDFLAGFALTASYIAMLSFQMLVLNV